MVFRSLLLVLTCLQSFTSAEGEKGPEKCCLRYTKSRIPVRLMTAYKETDIRCPIPAVIFILKKGHQVCANPEDEWVKKIMKTIYKRKFRILS